MALADIPGYGAYIQKRQMNEQTGPMAELQQVGALQGLLAKMQEQEATANLRTLMAESNGDPEKALAAALKSGNVTAAQHLAPIVKLDQERRQREDTPKLLASIYGNGAQPTAAPEQPVELGAGQPAGGAPEAPAAPKNAREQRLAALKAMTLIPAYANNAVVQQRLQAEIDKLENAKPLIEHNFPVAGKNGEPMVQPHQSTDNGVTWTPITGSVPSPKFAKQVISVNGGEQPVPPTADTIEMDAWRYLTDGTLPPNMGRGVQGTKQATEIRNRAAALSNVMGLSPDEIRMAQLTNKTQVAAIGQLAKAKAQILQFEKTASMNADLALQASEKVDRTGVPVLNRWIQAGRTEIAGDPEASKFNAATETFVSEYAKVMSGGYGAAATTEGAQNRAHQLLNTANTKEQFRQVVGQLKAEMGNRVAALNGQMTEERQNLRSGIVRPKAEPGPQQPAAAQASANDLGASAKAAWGAYEPDKYEYRVNGGILQRKAK